MKYRADIDGLRAIAVSAVVLFHAYAPLLPGGFVGVDIFFVISGYLIGSIIFREVRDGDFHFSDFYARRARRILPALFAMLLATSILALVLLTPTELKSFGRGAVSTIFAISNVQFWRGINYFAPSSEFNPLLMTWTLGVEEQFYVIVPIVILLLHKWRPGAVVGSIVVLCAASLALSIWQTARYPAAAFFLLPARAWELGAGVLLAMHEITRPHRMPQPGRWLSDVFSVGGFALLLVAMAWFDETVPFPGAAALLPILGTVMVILGKGGLINRTLLSARPIVFVGLISYSWYLWHWPPLSFARIAAIGPLTPAAAAGIVVLSFGLAVLSWKFIELPFRRRTLPSVPILARYGVATAVMAGLTASLGLLSGLPQRFPAMLTELQHRSDPKAGEACLIGYGLTAPSAAPRCMPPESDRAAVALIGDSHAAALGPALREAMTAKGIGYLEFTKSSCPPLVGATRFMPDHPGHDDECRRFNETAFKAVLDRNDVTTVVLAGLWAAPFTAEERGQRFAETGKLDPDITHVESRKNLQDGLGRAIEALLADNKQVVLVADVPSFSFDPVRQVATGFIPLRRWLGQAVSRTDGVDDDSATIDQTEEDESRAILQQVAEKYPQVRYVDLRKVFCDETECRFLSYPDPFFRDHNHLTIYGGRRAVAALGL